MRELTEPVFGILDPVAADDVGAARLVGLPEGNLVDPISLFHDPLAEAERREHLHCPACDAVGLAEEQSAGFLFDDPGLDVRKGRQLRRQGQSRRPAADDEDIDFRGKRIRRLGCVWLGRLRNFRVAEFEPVEVELHGFSLVAAVSQPPISALDPTEARPSPHVAAPSLTATERISNPFLATGVPTRGQCGFYAVRRSSGGEPSAIVGRGLLRLPTQTNGASLSWVSVAALFGAKEVV